MTYRKSVIAAVQRLKADRKKYIDSTLFGGNVQLWQYQGIMSGGRAAAVLAANGRRKLALKVLDVVEDMLK